MSVDRRILSDDEASTDTEQNCIMQVNKVSILELDDLDYEDDLPQLNPPLELIHQEEASEQNSASDEGEIDDGEIEDGELNDGQGRTATFIPRKPCYFYKKGKCTWGRSCKFLHPGVNDTGAYQFLEQPDLIKKYSDNSPSNPRFEENMKPMQTVMMSQEIPAAMAPVTESAWERGLRNAKQMREKAQRRKLQDKDFNDKKFNLSVKDFADDKDADDEMLYVSRSYPIEMDDRMDPHSNPYDDYAPLSLDNRMSYYYEHRELNYPDHFHEQDYRYKNDYSSNVKESSKERSLDDLRKRSHSGINSSSRGPYRSPGAADEWHDPWCRPTKRNKTHKRDISSSSSSYSSSSQSCSCSSSRSSTSSYSSRSSRHRRRRSPSVKRAKPLTPPVQSAQPKPAQVQRAKQTFVPEAKETVERSTKFLPGRHVSSHTLRKAAREGNKNSNSDSSSRSSSSSSTSSSEKVASSGSSSSCESSVNSTQGSEKSKHSPNASRQKQSHNGNIPASKQSKASQKVKSPVVETKSSAASGNNAESDQTGRQKKVASKEKTNLLRQLKAIEDEIARKRGKTKK